MTTGAKYKGTRIGFVRMNHSPRVFHISRSGLTITSPQGVSSTSINKLASLYANHGWAVRRFKTFGQLCGWGQ